MYYEFEKRNTPFFATVNFTTLVRTPHIHPHLELIYLTEGESLAVADNRTARLRAGDLYLAFPNQIHHYHAGTVKGYLIIVSAELFPDLQDYFTNKIPQSPVIRKEALPKDIVSRLERICAYVNAPDPLRHIAANGCMQSLLAELLMQMPLVDLQNDSNSVSSILSYCLSHYEEPLSLDVLAQKLHLSKYYISHIFTDRLNISFPDFLGSLRVESACRKLQSGCSITDAAYASGFNSIRSFNRNFVKHKGICPREYLRQMRL